MNLLRKCPCPLWLIRSTEQKGNRDIVAAVGFDHGNDISKSLNDQILETAMSLAVSESAQVHIVHAWRLAYERTLRSGRVHIKQSDIDAILTRVRHDRRRWIESLVARHSERLDKETVAGLLPKIHLTKGLAEDVVPILCDELGAKLVVMGTVRRVGTPGLMIGSTAEAILTEIGCSVLALKPDGFKCPVTLDS